MGDGVPTRPDVPDLVGSVRVDRRESLAEPVTLLAAIAALETELAHANAQLEIGHAAIRKVARIQQLISLAPKTAKGITIEALHEAMREN